MGEKSPEIVNAIIEIPAGGHNKYEYDEKLDTLKLDRVLRSPMFYPVDYGFIPQTRSTDGDHLDILVITQTPVFPGCLLEARVIGVLKMIDQGEGDDKILAVPVADIRSEHITNITDVDELTLKGMKHFFEQYKKLENKTVEVRGWEPKEAAYDVVNQSFAAFKAEQK